MKFTVLDVEVVRGLLRTMGQLGQPPLRRHYGTTTLGCALLVSPILRHFAQLDTAATTIIPPRRLVTAITSRLAMDR
jgi:hypothetical protein